MGERSFLTVMGFRPGPRKSGPQGKGGDWFDDLALQVFKMIPEGSPETERWRLAYQAAEELAGVIFPDRKRECETIGPYNGTLGDFARAILKANGDQGE